MAIRLFEMIDDKIFSEIWVDMEKIYNHVPGCISWFDVRQGITPYFGWSKHTNSALGKNEWFVLWARVEQ